MSRLYRSHGGSLVPDGDAPPRWVRDAHEALSEIIRGDDRPFPCYFAAIAEGQGALRYSHLNDDELAVPLPLHDSLIGFLSQAPTIPGRSALIVFAGHSGDKSLPEYEAEFWHLLQFLHDNDLEPWPQTIPTDPDDPGWEFCFGGQPLFITGHSPKHRKRKSRYAPSGLMLVIQTLANLIGIAGPGQAAAEVSRRIRGSLAEYDDIGPSPELGAYGEAGVREWKQYWLDDDNAPRLGRCPLKIGQAGDPA